MTTVIVYHSVFHATEQYARWLGEALGVEARPMRSKGDLSPFDRIIVMSGTYAGGMPLVKFLTKHWPELSGKQVVVVAVGAAPPDDPQSLLSYERIPAEIRAKITYFKIRGATPFANKAKRAAEVRREQLDAVIRYLSGT